MNEGSNYGGNGSAAHDGHDRREKVQQFARDANAQMEHARLVFEDFNERAIAFIRARPGTALLGALAVGWVVGKLASRGK